MFNAMTGLIYNQNFSGINLLIEAGFDVNIKNYKGESILYYVVTTNNVSAIPIIQILLSVGADMNQIIDNEISDDYGKTPYEKAIELNKFEIVKLFNYWT
jgi:ankyrin repeat protein